MSTTTNELRVIMEFEDGTTRTHVIPDIEDSALPSITERVTAVNKGTAPNADALRATFVSNEGASFVSISSAQIITTTEEVIYSD